MKTLEFLRLLLWMIAILAWQASCSTWSVLVSRFVVTPSSENVPLEFTLSGKELRNPLKLVADDAKEFQALQSSDAQIEVRVLNQGLASISTGTIAGDKGSRVTVKPGRSAVVYRGPAWKIILDGRNSGPFWIEGNDPSVRFTFLFSHLKSLQGTIHCRFATAPYDSPL